MCNVRGGITATTGPSKPRNLKERRREKRKTSDIVLEYTVDIRRTLLMESFASETKGLKDNVFFDREPMKNLQS